MQQVNYALSANLIPSTRSVFAEKLSSIAAVSHVTLITKEHSALEGHCRILHGGITVEKKSVSCPPGTDICVENLFYNIPARKKFLKNSATEWRAIAQLVQACALDYPIIHFTLYHDGKEFLQCPTTPSLAHRALHIFPREISFISLSAQNTSYNVSVSGIISPAHATMYNKNSIFFFINKRWVKNYSLARALIAGYKKSLSPDRYPLAALSLSLDPTHVDINIHPRKEEVKFMHPRVVEQLIEHAVASALEHHTTIQLRKGEKKSVPSYTPYTPAAHPSSAIPSPATFSLIQKNAILHTQHHISPVHTFDHEHIHPEKPLVSSAPSKTSTYAIIGQYAKTYIMVEHADGLMLVDQHAAHERILYELFAHRFTDISTVTLLFPHYIPLSASDYELLANKLHLFVDNGIQAEILSPQQLIITATPVHLKDRSLDDLVRQTIAWIDEYEHLNEKEFCATIHEKMRAQMACKAAVKAGDILSHDHMQQLLSDLYATHIHATCPHGRPTTFLISLYDIEKKFKRKT